MSLLTAPKTVKWPFFVGDALVIGLAWFFYTQARLPFNGVTLLACVACVALGAVLGIGQASGGAHLGGIDQRSGGADAQPGERAAGELALDAATYRVSFRGNEHKVGPTEFKLLHYLMKHAERVHTRGTLLDKIWGDHVFIEERTVDVHVKRLRESLGEAASMVETVRGAGYRLTGLNNTGRPAQGSSTAAA